MYLLTEQAITITQPVEVIYNYVTDMEHFGEWFPGVLSIESANNLNQSQPGKEYLETVSNPLKGKSKITIKVKEAQANKLFITEGEFPPLMPRMEIDFHELPDNVCSITWRMFSRNNNYLIRVTLLQLVKKIMHKRATIGLKQLKQKIEQSIK